MYPTEVARTALLAGAVVLAVAAACSTQAKLAGSGAQCFAATDCQEGLFCLPQKGGTSICSNDVSAIQMTEDAAAGGDAAKPMGDGAAAGDDGATTGEDSAAAPDTGTPMDSGTPDTSTPDTSAPDTSTPDSAPPVDASMPDDAAAD